MTAPTNSRGLSTSTFMIGSRILGEPVLRNSRKQALAATSNEVKEWRIKLESLKSEIAKCDGQQNAHRAERDKLFQGLATWKGKSGEFEKAVTDAQTVEFRVQLQPDEERTIAYTAHYTW